MSIKKYVVRVVQTQYEDEDGLAPRREGGTINIGLLESFERMSLVTIHKIDHGGLTRLCFDIYPPSNVEDTLEWAEVQSYMMEELGFNAVAAPSTNE